MDAKPKVSVIVPVYNAEKYLQECLDSIKGQTLEEIEIIIVNDGSTDSSEKICKVYCESDSRFKLLCQENGGLAAARKTGMLAAKGEYIGFVDSDDWIEFDMFDKMYSKAHETGVDIVFCNCIRETGNKSIKFKKYLRCGYYDRNAIETEILPRTLAGINEKGQTGVIRWSNCLRIFRRELLCAHEIYNDSRLRRCQDLQITFEATFFANSFYYLGDEYLYHNRVVGDSLSRGYTVKFWEKLRLLINILYRDLERFDAAYLKNQMDLCTFFFAVEACNNVWRANNTKREKEEELNEIFNDDFVVQSLSSIPIERLDNVNRAFYSAIKKKSYGITQYARFLKHIQIKTTKIKGNVYAVVNRRR